VFCKLGNYFPYRNSSEFLRKAAFLVNIELQLENQLQHLMYVNKRLEVIANKIEDQTLEKIKLVREDLFNTAAKISDLINTENKYVDVF
jgi:shikimate kinase